MKKKFKVLIICLLLITMSVFTGCSLVESNNDKLYNQVVAEVYRDGKKVADITNRELLSGYESYGQTYVQYYGYSVSDAVDMTLKQIENRKITLILAKEKYNVDYATGAGLTELEKSYLYDSTVESLYSNLDSYYDDIVNNQEEETDSDDIKFDGYNKSVELVYQEKEVQDPEDPSKTTTVYIPVIQKIEKENGILDDYHPEYYKSYYNDNDRAEIYDNLVTKALSSQDYRRAFEYYILDLESAEWGTNVGKKDVHSMFQREIERLYKVNYENYLLEKYSDSNKTNAQISSVTVDQILKLYSSKVRAGYTKYVIESNSSYDNDVSSSVNSVYYFNPNASTKYFKVANILFQFSEEQQNKYNEIEEEWENAKFHDEKTEAEYNSKLNALYSQIVPVIRQKNEVTGVYEESDQKDTVDNLINDIKRRLSGAQATGRLADIGDTINDLIYTYNQDTGMFNAEANYVIGVDSEGKAVSNFVESFNEAGLKLYDQNVIGNVEIARSNYGVHVLVYTGKCENIFNDMTIDENFELGGNANYYKGSNLIERLANTRVNLLVDKTYFDVLFDEIFEDNYSYFEQANLLSIIDRDNYTLKVYRGRFSDTLKD